MEFNLSPPVESSKFFECVIAQKYCPSSAMDMCHDPFKDQDCGIS